MAQQIPGLNFFPNVNPLQSNVSQQSPFGNPTFGQSSPGIPQLNSVSGSDQLFNQGPLTPNAPFQNNGYVPNFPNFNANDSSTFGAVGLPGAVHSLKLLGPDGVLIPGLNALSGLAGAYTGLQQYGLQKEAFDLTKDLTKTNLFNQAQVTNSQIEDKARAAAIASGRDTPAGLDAARKQADQRKIRGTF